MSKKLLIAAVIFVISGLLSSSEFDFFLTGFIPVEFQTMIFLPGFLFGLALLLAFGNQRSFYFKSLISKVLLVVFSTVAYSSAWYVAASIGFSHGYHANEFFEPYLMGGFVGTSLLLIGLILVGLRLSAGSYIKLLILGILLSGFGPPWPILYYADDFGPSWPVLYVVWQTGMGIAILKYASLREMTYNQLYVQK